MIITPLQGHADVPDLTPDEAYFVIGIEADAYRIINDHGRPYLYPPDFFRVIDDRQPAQWVVERGEDGELYAYPPDLNRPGFFEDYFDREPQAVSTFWHTVNKTLTSAA